MRSEFEFIRNIKKKYELKRVGDDCAVVPKDSKTDLVITADLLVEDIDFRLDWMTPEFLGHKALTVSLSDIASMGATPKWAMLSIAVPETLWKGDFLDRFYDGWHSLAKQFGVELIGGDVSRSPDKLVIDSIVTGETAKGKAILRSGARSGDFIFVTGSLGGAAGGLSLLESGVRFSKAGKKRDELMARQLCPTPRVEIAKHLARRDLATSMIDISDGLGADLHHLCDASGVGARIDVDNIPVDANLDAVAPDNLQLALGGGDDFELLFTSKQKRIASRKLPSITRIGEVTTNAGVVELVGADGARIFPATGYRHF